MNIKGRETEIFNRALDEMGIELVKEESGYSAHDKRIDTVRGNGLTTAAQVMNSVDVLVYDYYIQPLNEQFEDRRDLFDEISGFCVNEFLDDWCYGDWVMVFDELDEITRKDEVRALIDKYEPTVEVLSLIAHSLDNVDLDEAYEAARAAKKERVGAYERDCS